MGRLCTRTQPLPRITLCFYAKPAGPIRRAGSPLQQAQTKQSKARNSDGLEGNDKNKYLKFLVIPALDEQELWSNLPFWCISFLPPCASPNFGTSRKLT